MSTGFFVLCQQLTKLYNTNVCELYPFTVTVVIFWDAVTKGAGYVSEVTFRMRDVNKKGSLLLQKPL